jgi:hypothetical protein
MSLSDLARRLDRRKIPRKEERRKAKLMGTLPGFRHQVTEMAGQIRDQSRQRRLGVRDWSPGGLSFRDFRTVSVPAPIEAAVKTPDHFCGARSETAIRA